MSRKITMKVEQVDGGYEVVEHDHRTDEETLCALFHDEVRSTPVKGEFGPELAVKDVAKMRADIFATTMEQLVNNDHIDLG